MRCLFVDPSQPSHINVTPFSAYMLLYDLIQLHSKEGPFNPMPHSIMVAILVASKDIR